MCKMLNNGLLMLLTELMFLKCKLLPISTGNQEKEDIHEKMCPMTLTNHSLSHWKLRCCLVTKSCLTVPPWTAAFQPPLSSTVSWSLLKFTSIDSVMPSNHLILCCPLFFCLPSFPASGSFPAANLISKSRVNQKATSMTDKVLLVTRN